jgi:hypothetical protein
MCINCQGFAAAQSSLPVDAQSQKPELVTMTIDMDDAKIASLLRNGVLRTTIPAKYRNRVDAVLLKRDFSFKTEAYELGDAVDKLNDSVTVKLGAAVLERLDFQPVKVKIYYSGFNSIVFVRDKLESKNPFGLAKRDTQPGPNDSQRMFARLDDKRGVFGWVEGLAKLKLTTEFGEVSIDMIKVAGIRFNTNSSGGVSVRLISGETLSGYPSFDEIQMKCAWGKQKILLSEIESITLNRQSRFTLDPYHNGRWRFEIDLTPGTLRGSSPSVKSTTN